MRSVIGQLMRPGGLEVARHFRKARQFWTKFYKDHRKDDAAALAEALTYAQSSYESAVGGSRSSAKDTMAVTCIGALYDPQYGWGPRRRRFAARLAKAFNKSSVSLEIKFGALEAARMYNLGDDDAELREYMGKWFNGR